MPYHHSLAKLTLILPHLSCNGSDPGTRLVWVLSRRDGSAASGAARRGPRSPVAGGDNESRRAVIYDGINKAVEDFNEFLAFWAERRKTAASVDWSKKTQTSRIIMWRSEGKS